MAFLAILLCLSDGHFHQFLLSGLAKVDSNPINCGEDIEIIGIYSFGEFRGRQILVDYGRYSLVITVLIPDDRYAPSSAGDNDKAVIEQAYDRFLFNNVDGLRRGYHPSPASPCVFGEDHARIVGHQFLGGSFIIKAANRLGGCLKSRIIHIHFHLSYHCGHQSRQSFPAQLLADTFLQMIAYIALAHGCTFGQSHRGYFIIYLRSFIEGQIDHANLRPIAVAKNNFMLLLD